MKKKGDFKMTTDKASAFCALALLFQ